MVFKGEEERTRRETENVVGRDVGIFPGERFKIREDRIALLTGRDED